MLEFFTLKTKAFGLDISDLSLKIVQLKKKGNFFALSSFGEFSIEPGIIKEGEIREPEALLKIIKKALKEVKGKNLQTKYVLSSLPEEKAFLEVIQMPKMKEEELKKAISFEVENYIPLSIKEVYFDFQVIPPVFEQLDRLDVLIAALPKKIVDVYVSVFKKAGLKPKALEVESQAICRALIKKELSSFPLLIIDLGATKTGFIIFSGHSLRYTTSIPVSSQTFTEAISKTLKINLKKAEELKIQYGLLPKTGVQLKGKGGNFQKEITQEKKIFEALIPSLTDLTEQIKKHLDFYLTHNGQEPPSLKKRNPEKVLLCGGGANLRGLPECLTELLQIPVELGNPWVNILPQPKIEIPQMEYQQSLKYATALGLALRGTQDD